MKKNKKIKPIKRPQKGLKDFIKKEERLNLTVKAIEDITFNQLKKLNKKRELYLESEEIEYN